MPQFEEVLYATKIEDTGTYKYIGEVAPGLIAATAQPVWRITRISATGDVEYANTGKPDQIWNNRASLSYS